LSLSHHRHVVLRHVVRVGEPHQPLAPGCGLAGTAALDGCVDVDSATHPHLGLPGRWVSEELDDLIDVATDQADHHQAPAAHEPEWLSFGGTGKAGSPRRIEPDPTDRTPALLCVEEPVLLGAVESEVGLAATAHLGRVSFRSTGTS